jgi:hypothetical protein
LQYHHGAGFLVAFPPLGVLVLAAKAPHRPGTAPALGRRAGDGAVANFEVDRQRRHLMSLRARLDSLKSRSQWTKAILCLPVALVCVGCGPQLEGQHNKAIPCPAVVHKETADLKLEAVEFCKQLERHGNLEGKTVIVWGKIYRASDTWPSTHFPARWLVSFVNNEYDPNAELGYRTLEYLIYPKVFLNDPGKLRPGQVAAFKGKVQQSDLPPEVELIALEENDAGD